MSQETESKTKNLREIEDVIARAIKKVGAKRESDLCRYIAMPGGGYMHHFTWKKKKKKQPQELGALIEESIINLSHPSRVAPKPRASRGSRRRRNPIAFTRNQIEKLLGVALQTGDKEIVTLLSPQIPLEKCKKELIASIRHNRVEPELWNAFAEAVNAQQLIQNHQIVSQSNK